MRAENGSVAGPCRRMVLPAMVPVVLWVVFWIADNYFLQQTALALDRPSLPGYYWPAIPAVVLLPRFSWLLFPVLLLCLHRATVAGASPVERVAVAAAPAVVAPLIYWKSLHGLVWVTSLVQESPEPYMLYTARWSMVFFLPEYVALVLLCVSAVGVYALGRQALSREQRGHPAAE